MHSPDRLEDRNYYMALGNSKFRRAFTTRKHALNHLYLGPNEAYRAFEQPHHYAVIVSSISIIMVETPRWGMVKIRACHLKTKKNQRDTPAFINIINSTKSSHFHSKGRGVTKLMFVACNNVM